MALSDFRFQIDNAGTAAVTASANFLSQAQQKATANDLDTAATLTQMATQAATQAERLAEARKQIDGLT